ncbi:MAG TPA: serine hydrolase domain-containing protein [Jatrophihabitans sp.]|jgi:CubicO group peptidase (beta-lactamase class C family)
MTGLRDLLQFHVDSGSAPGLVALVARGEDVDVQAAGLADVQTGSPMARDSIFRIASVTKPIIAAAAMTLVDDGRMALGDPVAQWLPELASASMLRTPASPIEDVVPALRPITVYDLLSSRAGYGFPSDFSLPVVPLLLELQPGPQPRLLPAPDEWLARLARLPMLSQPGEAWLYNTSSDILGVLIARVAGRPLPEFLAERLFEPLGMSDTGFEVPADKWDRFTSLYWTNPAGELEKIDDPDGQWRQPPAFASGAGGLVSTVDDLHAFARMLIDGGTAGGRRLVSAESVRLMTTDQLTQAQRDAGEIFLEGQGWGFGGSVDVQPIDPWNVAGRYGWIGGTGTAAHLTAATGLITILLSQQEMTGPSAPAVMRDFWQYAASVE